MNQQTIKAFLAIAEEKSISGAARVLNYSQPTVSEHLNQLEKKLGIQLVLREKGARKVILTPAGKAFIPLAEHYLDVENQIKQFAKSQKKNELRLGASVNGHEYIVSQIMHKLMRRNPEVKLQLNVIERREIMGAIAEQQFDVLFYLGTYPDDASIMPIPLFSEERYVLCSTATGLPNRVISPKELDLRNEIRYSDDSGNTIIPWRKANFPEDNEQTSLISSNMTIAPRYLTADPRYWTIVPASMAIMVTQTNPEQLTYRRVEPEIPHRMCTLLVSKFYTDKQIIETLLKCCDEYIAERPYLHRKER